MRKSRFTESQIVAILKEGEAGLPVAGLVRKHGISKATCFLWRSIVEISPMITLELTGWRPDLRKVSLVRAIRDHSTASLPEAHAMLDELLSGSTVTLVFETEDSRDEFRRQAEDLGVSIRE